MYNYSIVSNNSSLFKSYEEAVKFPSKNCSDTLILTNSRLSDIITVLCMHFRLSYFTKMGLLSSMT